MACRATPSVTGESQESQIYYHQSFQALPELEELINAPLGHYQFVLPLGISHNRQIMRLVSVLVAVFAVPLPPALAQQALNLVVVQGEGAINNVRQRTARDPIVPVEDQNHKTIAGAA